MKAGPPSVTPTANVEDNIFDWSTPWSTKTDKRKNKQNSPTGISPKLKHSNSTYTFKNRFSPLAHDNLDDDDDMETDTSTNLSQTKLPLPPPIFIKIDIVQFNLFCKSIK